MKVMGIMGHVLHVIHVKGMRSKILEAIKHLENKRLTTRIWPRITRISEELFLVRLPASPGLGLLPHQSARGI